MEKELIVLNQDPVSKLWNALEVNTDRQYKVSEDVINNPKQIQPYCVIRVFYDNVQNIISGKVIVSSSQTMK